jgi:hypothetical protein
MSTASWLSALYGVAAAEPRVKSGKERSDAVFYHNSDLDGILLALSW